MSSDPHITDPQPSPEADALARLAAIVQTMNEAERWVMQEMLNLTMPHILYGTLSPDEEQTP